MTLYEFKLLEFNEQASVTWDLGVLLDIRDEENMRLLLYQIDGFYVEVVYDETENKIDRIISFISLERLQPYLDRIDIATL